jgi:hypothetical protein
MADERREKALMSLVSRARNGDPDGKEGLEKLLNLFKPFPQFSEWVAEQMAPAPVNEPQAPQPSIATPVDESLSPHWSIRELTRRQIREAGDAPALVTPESPNPERYANGQFNPGLKLADQLKRLFGSQPERGDGSWMRKR